ncbi:hypothetical protein CWM47_34125 [Spirosoma pollinicola]|uniref:HTH LytTR-type domain-containing protein n=1 Tax=Spirosoma pollinicola TaxID=2057025 RepID=A0A2K8Z993_9BACT|nr:hypothetical protein CWM47_34125 [Spirosoma pollinicola]
MKKGKSTSTGSYLLIAGYHGRELIEADQIIRLQGERNYTWLYLANGEKHILASTLKRIEAILPHFLRINKGHLINPIYIKRFHDSSPPAGRKISASRASKGMMLLHSGDRLPWSRRRLYHYLEAFAN